GNPALEDRGRREVRIVARLPTSPTLGRGAERRQPRAALLLSGPLPSRRGKQFSTSQALNKAFGQFLAEFQVWPLSLSSRIPPSPSGSDAATSPGGRIYI